VNFTFSRLKIFSWGKRFFSNCMIRSVVQIHPSLLFCVRKSDEIEHKSGVNKYDCSSCGRSLREPGQRFRASGELIRW
jgi:hypothetical protein